MLDTVRELIGRIEKAQAEKTAKSDLIAALKQSADAMQPAGRGNRNSQAAINQAASRDVILVTNVRVGMQSPADALTVLRAWEHALSANTQAPVAQRRTLQISAALLLALDGLEQRLEISLAETAAALALDHLVEQRGTVFHRAREDLQHVAFVVAIHQDAELLQLVDRLVDLADARQQVVVVGGGHAQKIHALPRAACPRSR